MKLKAFADVKLNLAKMMISLFDRVENIVGKGENVGYQHFLLFLQCFPKPSSSGVGKSRDCLVKSKIDLFDSVQKDSVLGKTKAFADDKCCQNYNFSV